jgi:hypothetical protein
MDSLFGKPSRVEVEEEQAEAEGVEWRGKDGQQAA